MLLKLFLQIKNGSRTHIVRKLFVIISVLANKKIAKKNMVSGSLSNIIAKDIVTKLRLK